MLKQPRPLSSLLLLLILQTCLQIRGPTRAAFSEEDKREFVLTHNRLRQSLHPTAKAMNYITWSESLANLARKAAESCKLSHIRPESAANLYKNLGENMYLGPTGATSPYNVTMTWYSERSHFNISQPTWVAKPGCSTDYYSNMMATDVTAFGCDFFDCNESRLVFCEYDKKSSGARYETGPLCSACPADRPFCLSGLCISEGLSRSDEIKRLDPTAKAECKLVCRFCGTIMLPRCTCDCNSSMGRGQFCDEDPDLNKECPPCGRSNKCQNNGTAFKSNMHPSLTLCACLCPPEFVGNLCEIPADVHLNSMKMTFSMRQWFQSGSLAVKPPVSRSQFNTEIWSLKFRSTLATVITKFCQNRHNFQWCCAGKVVSEHTQTDGKSYIGSDDVRYFNDTVGNTIGGDLQIVLYINLPKGNTLCQAGENTFDRQVLGTVKSTPGSEFVPWPVVSMATFEFRSQIQASLPPGVTVKSVENLESKFDMGEAYQSHRTIDFSKSAAEVDRSNITACIVEHVNITAITGAVKLETKSYFQLTASVLIEMLILTYSFV